MKWHKDSQCVILVFMKRPQTQSVCNFGFQGKGRKTGCVLYWFWFKGQKKTTTTTTINMIFWISRKGIKRVNGLHWFHEKSVKTVWYTRFQVKGKKTVHMVCRFLWKGIKTDSAFSWFWWKGQTTKQFSFFLAFMERSEEQSVCNFGFHGKGINRQCVILVLMERPNNNQSVCYFGIHQKA